MLGSSSYSTKSPPVDFFSTNTPRHHFGKIVTDILLGLLYSSVLTYSGLGMVMLILSMSNQQKPNVYDSQTSTLALLGGTICTSYYTIALQFIRFISASPRSIWLEECSMTAKEAAHIFIAVVIGVGLNTGLYNGSAGDISYPYYKSNQAKAPDTVFLYEYLTGIALLYLVIHKPFIWFDYIRDTGEWLFQVTPETKVTNIGNETFQERNWKRLLDWESQTQSMIYYGTPGNPGEAPIQNTPVANSPNRYPNPSYDLPLAKSPCRRFMENNPRSFMTKLLNAINQRWNEMPGVEDAQGLILTALEQTPLKDTASRRKKLLRHRAGHGTNSAPNTQHTQQSLMRLGSEPSSARTNNPIINNLATSSQHSVISDLPTNVRLSQNFHAIYNRLCHKCKALLNPETNGFDASTESDQRGLSDDSLDRALVNNFYA